jgi:hypothetical protein
MSVVTDLPKINERKQQVEQITGRKADQITSVRIQLDVLRKQGLLIDLNISGTGMFTKTASFDEVGFAQDSTKDARYEWIKPGVKYVIPEAPIKKLKSVESRMRQALDKYTRDVKGFYPFRWLPFTAHPKWTELWNQLQDDFYAIKAEIIENRDNYVDQIAEEYARVGISAWQSIKAQGYKWAIVEGKKMDSDTFVDYIVEKAVALVPTIEAIEEKLQADYVTALVYGDEDVARDETNAAAIREQLDLSRAMNQIEVSRASELARAEAWQIQAAQREREIKIEAMLQAEAEHARAQLQSVTSPFAEIFGALRSQMAEDASDILNSIKKNGFVRGKVAERGRGLLEMFDLMATHDDKELRSKLIALRSQLGPVGTKQTDDSRDVETISQTLTEIMQLEKQAARDLASGPSRFSALDV